MLEGVNVDQIYGAVAIGGAAAVTWLRERRTRASFKETLRAFEIGNGELRKELEWERSERTAREVRCDERIAELRGQVTTLERMMADGLVERISSTVTDAVHSALQGGRRAEDAG